MSSPVLPRVVQGLDVEEERTEIFPKFKSSSLDLVELSERMTARKDELLAQVA